MTTMEAIMINDIDELSYEELLTLNDRIIERLKFLDRVDTHDAMMQFHPGARVSFHSPKRGPQTGTITKFNQKTVTVLTDDGRRWNVVPQMLSAIEKPTEKTQKTSTTSSQPMNVIDIRKKTFEPV